MKKTLAALLCTLMLVSMLTSAVADTKVETAKLQLYLMNYGYYSKKIDGDFGNNTRKALSEFQAANGLEVTGEADDQTKKLLYEGHSVVHSSRFELRDGITWGMSVDDLDKAMAKEGIESHEDIEKRFTLHVYRKVPVSNYEVSMGCVILGDLGLQAVIYVTIPNSLLKGSELIEDSDNLKSLLEMKYGNAKYDNWSWTDSDYSYVFSEDDGAAMGYYTRLVQWSLGGTMLELCVNEDAINIGLARKATVWIGYYNELFADMDTIIDNVTDDDIALMITECMGIEIEEPNTNGL